MYQNASIDLKSKVVEVSQTTTREVDTLQVEETKSLEKSSMKHLERVTRHVEHLSLSVHAFWYRDKVLVGAFDRLLAAFPFTRAASRTCRHHCRHQMK